MSFSSVSQTDSLAWKSYNTLNSVVSSQNDSIEVFTPNNAGNNIDEFSYCTANQEQKKGFSETGLRTACIALGATTLGIATTLLLKKNSLNLIKKYKTLPVFKPKVVAQEKGAPSVLSLYNDNLYHILSYGDGYYSKNCNPITMLQKTLPKQKVMYVSNFHYPGGSISASSRLGECIVTDKMYQCASVAIVDSKKGVQTLAHCFPKQTQNEITELLRQSIVDSNPKDLSITIVQGCYDISESTIVGIKNAIENLAPNVKIKYADFPRNIGYFDRAVMLHNGELCACTSQEIKDASKIINPKDYISYVSRDGYNNNRFRYFISKK